MSKEYRGIVSLTFFVQFPKGGHYAYSSSKEEDYDTSVSLNAGANNPTVT
ncbi:MAG: hypothetical protein PVSMB5_05800 [Ktedonobacteraceae bacterium]